MKKKNFLYLICLLSICLLGCSQEKSTQNTDNLKKVVKELFNPISDEEYQQVQNGSSVFSASGWMGERFKDAMTEEAYNTFVGTGTYQMMMLSHENGCHMDAEEVKINEKEDYHEFRVKLKVSHKNGDAENLEVNGTAQFDEKGKVRYLNFNNMDELVGILQK